MKKIIVGIILFVCLGFFFACGGDHTITLLLEDGTEYKVVTYSENLQLESLTKEGYDFLGWYTSQDEKWDGSELETNINLYAKFKAKEYTYKFVVDGEVIKEEKIKYGSTIIYPENPTKEETNGVSYVFSGWDKSDTILKEDIIFNAVFTEEVKKFTVKFVVDGKVIEEKNLPYNSTIKFPEDPTKESTDQYSYKFIGWDNTVTTLLKDEVFNAKFEEVERFVITFIDANGDIIKEDILDNGDEIIFPEPPVKESDAKYDYEFTGWDRNDKYASENLIIEALYSSSLRKYNVKFVNDDGDVLKEELVEYGTLPTEPTKLTKPSSSDYEYVFSGWDNRINYITEDTIYTAVYEKIKIHSFESLEGKVLSILGDSISTFYSPTSEVNSYYTDTNTYYYPTYSASIKTVDKTWWYQLYNKTQMKLGINNSWSGTCAEESGDRAGYSDARINTLDDNGSPDIVIIYLGTNDNASGVSLGAYKSAVNKMIDKVRKLCDAQIYLVTLGYSAYTGMYYKESTRIEYNNVLRELAETRKCGIIPLDEYVVEDNYSIYLGDFLHYNAKGAELLSKVSEKAIKEFNGIEYNEEIKVEYPEKLPEGTLAKIQATAGTGFWDNDGYLNNVYFNVANSSNVATFSLSYEITKNETNGKYYVTEINKSGDKASYNCDYVLLISELNNSYGNYMANLANVKVGSIVEFEFNNNYPVDILFLEGDGEGPEVEDNTQNTIEGQLHIGAYNTSIWTLYNSSAIAYEYGKVVQNSTYINFYTIKLSKESDNTYKIVGLKDIDVKEDFSACDIIIFIYRDLTDKSYFENAKLDGIVTVIGDITSGNCNLKFE